ncbi:MAG: hypothetical protein E6I72_10365, partial [Chloroflexi bacterium]
AHRAGGRSRLQPGWFRASTPGDRSRPGKARTLELAAHPDVGRPRRRRHPGSGRERPQCRGRGPGSAPGRGGRHGPRPAQAGLAAGRGRDRRARAPGRDRLLSGLNPAIAFLAGLVSFVSPCVLPLVPAYLAYLGGRRAGTDSIPIAGAGFVAGLSLILILFFYVFSLAVQPVRAYVPVVAGVLVLVMALQVAGLVRIPLLSTEYRLMKAAPQGGGAAGGFLLGMGFASGWTPCIGVTLGAVLSSAVTAGTTPQGLSLMIAYCLGLGLPFLALAFGLENARPLVSYVNAHRRAIDLGSAAVLVVMGLLLLTNRLTWLSAGLVQLIPSWPSPSL